MSDIVLLPPVCKLLVDLILEKAAVQLIAEGIMNEGERFSLDWNSNQLFGTGRFHPGTAQRINEKKTVGYALVKYLERQEEEALEGDFFTNNFNHNPRRLQDLYATYSGRTFERQHLILSEAYFKLFYNFVGYKSPEDLMNSGLLAKEIIEEQLELLKTETSSPIVSPQTDRLLYWCHTLYRFSDSTIRLHTFPATFTIRNKSTKVHILQTPEGDEFQGDLWIKAGGREALITLWSNNPNFNRPMSIVISQQTNDKFSDLDVCIGQYITVRHDAVNIAGPIVFEKKKGELLSPQLNADLLEIYLNNLDNTIPTGGYLRIADFQEKLNNIGQQQISSYDLYKQFTGMFFRAILLTKKGRRDTPNEQLNRIELSYFAFANKGEFTCRSIYPTGTITYTGNLKFHSFNKAILQFKTLLGAQYQLSIDLRDFKESGNISGVYCGITQDNTLAAGRVKFYSIAKEEYVNSKPEILELHEDNTRILMYQYPDLKNFLSGESDNYLDNPQVFVENPGEVFAQGRQVLEKLPGTYYYYRTRTIKGHIREVKRYPLLIEASGNISVKIKADGEEYTAIGKAIRKNDRVYMHLHKKDRYDGLAILYPNWYRLDTTSPIIQAVYASTSKSGHLMAGRMVLLRLSNDTSGKLFDTLSPDNIDIDHASSRLDVQPEEIPIIEKLAGKINNYIAIRHHNEEPPSALGNELFAAACFYAGNNYHDLALQTLRMAFMYGGFNDIEQLRQALSPQGVLRVLAQQIKSMPDNFDITSPQGEDQREYLQHLLNRLHEQ